MRRNYVIHNENLYIYIRLDFKRSKKYSTTLVYFFTFLISTLSLNYYTTTFHYKKNEDFTIHYYILLH